MAEKRDSNRITDSRDGKALTQRIERSHVFFTTKLPIRIGNSWKMLMYYNQLYMFVLLIYLAKASIYHGRSSPLPLFDATLGTDTCESNTVRS